MTDNRTPAERSYNMSRIRGMDTTPELIIRRVAHARGLRYRTHVMTLPGRPDMVFTRLRVAVFVDGDFWHGWQYPRWRERLTKYWREKIERNRRRDKKNFRRLRRAGWTVVRIWEHEVHTDPHGCVDRIESALAKCL